MIKDEMAALKGTLEASEPYSGMAAQLVNAFLQRMTS